MARHRVLGVSFDHMHMGDLLMKVAEHPDAEIAGIFDPDRERMQAAIARFGPLDPAVSLIGQRIIDSAVLSSTTKRTVALVP